MVAEIPPFPPPPPECKCGCGLPAKPGSKYHDGACRARYSRQRRNQADPGRVVRAQLVKHGEVSITLRLSHDWAHRMHELVPGTWVELRPKRGKS